MNDSQFYIHAANHRADGTIDTCYTVSVEHKISELWWQKQGLSFTASGYGKRIPTRHMVKFNGKWRRVYCHIFSNRGTLYIGKLDHVGERLIVQDYK